MKYVTLIVLALASAISQAADIKYSAALRTAQVGTIEPRVGPRPLLRLCGGATPASVGTPDGGLEYAEIQLPEDWATAPLSPVVSMKGTWQGTVNFNGTPTHFRIYATDGVTPHIQGSVTGPGGGGVVTVPLPLVAGRAVKVTGFTIIAGNDVTPSPAAPNRAQYSIAIQDDKLNAIEPIVGSGFLKFITGSLPPSVAASDPGVVVATMPLGANWLGTASGGIVSTLATLLDASADATGTATHARFFQSDSTTPHIQVDVTGTAGNGVIKLSSTSVVAGDTVSVSSPFNLVAGNQ